LHYTKWDLAREKGLMDLQKERFDYDFTNIFRSTQDLDIVVDGDLEDTKAFQDRLAAKYPHFLGSKAAWEGRSLTHKRGKPGGKDFKEGVIDEPDFNDQKKDSNSIGMVEITESDEPLIRDLKHWKGKTSAFLEDSLRNEVRFFRSDKHFTTSRAKMGENPEI